MNYQNRVKELKDEIVSELRNITDRPDGWLPHTVYVEEEGENSQGLGVAVYTEYKLLKYEPNGECQLLNVATNTEETRDLYEIEIDWLVTVLNWYGDLTGKQITSKRGGELWVFVYPVELGCNITDKELIKLWYESNSDIK